MRRGHCFPGPRVCSELSFGVPRHLRPDSICRCAFVFPPPPEPALPGAGTPAEGDPVGGSASASDLEFKAHTVTARTLKA